MNTMADRLINNLRPMLNHDHPEWVGNHFIRATGPDQAIDRHRFGYHISTLRTTILQRNMELVTVIEDRAPYFPIGMFLPLSEEQCTLIEDYEPANIQAGQLCVYRMPESGVACIGQPSYIYFAAMHMMLDCRAGVKAYFDAVSLMQKELAKLLERADRILRVEVPGNPSRRIGPTSYRQEGGRGNDRHQ